MEDQMVSEDFCGIRDKGDSLAQQCFVDDNDKKLAEISNELI